MRRQRTSPLVLGSRILEIMVGAVQLVELSRSWLRPPFAPLYAA